MLNHREFTNKWLGRYNDYDLKWNSQCTDLMRQYVKDIYGLNPYAAIPTTGAAKNIYYNFRDNQYFKKIPNTPTGIPPQGAILFFKTSIWYPWLFGWAGHVGIIDSANINSLILFNQNYPTGSPCNFRKFTYKDTLGWMIRK